MRIPLIAFALLTALLLSRAPTARASGVKLDPQMVILKIKHVGETNQPIPILFLTRDLAAADLAKNAVLDHQIYNLGEEQFQAVQSFWANEVRESQTGPLLCGDVLEHGSFEIAARSADGTLGFDFILPPGPSAEHLRRFEKFLEARKVSSNLTASLKTVLTSL